ncbi:MAG: CotH kinase family protein [Candidatus Sabulitectum sp.]|nr:CotH kinase family protein [Candidatus Sabulitectum sp.]
MNLILMLSLSLFASVPQYNVTCDPDHFQMMMQNWEEEITISCTVEHQGVVYENCTMRIRGDSSREFRKKSYRVEFPLDQPLDGRTAWNFNADFLDLSYTKSWLFSRVLSDMGFPCFQASHANLSVNGDNRGLFILLEPVNKAFLARNSFNIEGNLYKAQVDGSCANIYDDIDSVWSKKTNESAGMNDLVELIQNTEYTTPDNFQEFMDSTFTMYGSYGLIRLLAINAAFANNSTYYHNYYLYNDVEGTGAWAMLPWDVDKILYDNLGIGYGLCTTRNWFDNPLHARTLVVPEFRDAFIDSVETIYDSFLTEEKLQFWTDSLKAVLEQSVSQDNYDTTDVAGFHAASDSLIKHMIHRRTDLQWQFQYRYYPFRSLRSDTVSTGDLTIRWHPTEDPMGAPAVYSVIVRDSLGPDTLEVFRIEGLTDTTYTISGLDPGEYHWVVEADVQVGWRVTEATPRYNPFVVTEPTILSGTLGENTVLYSAHSPYIVQGEVTIPHNGTMTIQPGVTILMGEDGAINCLGELNSTGSEGDSVFFMAENSAVGWRGIRVHSGSVSMQYTSVTGSEGYSLTPGTDFAALSGHSSTVLLENSSFRNNWSCVKLTGGTAGIEDCRFINNRGELFFIQDGESASITNSDFINLYDPVASSMDGIEFHLCTGGQFLVSGCTVENIDGDCIDMNASSVTIENTFLSSSTDKGFSVGAPTGGSGSGTLVQIENCVITSCPIGIGVKDGAAVEGSGIVFSECGTAVHAYEKTSGMGGGLAYITSSIFTECPLPVLVDMGVVSTTWSISDTEELSGEGNLHDDPVLTEDFFPLWNSPCINSGDPDLLDPDNSRRDMGAYFYPTFFSGLVVNEIMALNTVTISDDWGRTSDWIEVYNGTGYAIDAGVLVFFESDSSAAVEWSVPRGTMIPSGGFILLWADGDTWKGGTHLPFRLSGGGDSFKLGRIVPGNGDTSTISTLEQVQFDNQMPDVSFGRFPDGGEWRILETATPGYSNGTLYSVPTLLGWPGPNPCTTGQITMDITVAGGETDVFVYDMAGRKIATIVDGYLSPGTHSLHWNTATRPTGIYLIFARCAGQTPATAKVTVLR